MMRLPAFLTARSFGSSVVNDVCPTVATLAANPIYPVVRIRCYPLGMEDELGTLEVNKRADLVILNANPLTDVANLNRITQVMVKGNLIDRDQLTWQTIH